jgi:hypothetical protein
MKQPVFVKHIHYQVIFSISLSLLGFGLDYVDGTIIILSSTDKKHSKATYSKKSLYAFSSSSSPLLLHLSITVMLLDIGS